MVRSNRLVGKRLSLPEQFTAHSRNLNIQSLDPRTDNIRAETLYSFLLQKKLFPALLNQWLTVTPPLSTEWNPPYRSGARFQNRASEVTLKALCD